MFLDGELSAYFRRIFDRDMEGVWFRRESCFGGSSRIFERIADRVADALCLVVLRSLLVWFTRSMASGSGSSEGVSVYKLGAQQQSHSYFSLHEGRDVGPFSPGDSPSGCLLVQRDGRVLHLTLGLCEKSFERRSSLYEELWSGREY